MTNRTRKHITPAKNPSIELLVDHTVYPSIQEAYDSSIYYPHPYPLTS